jgi:hypothetical protein
LHDRQQADYQLGACLLAKVINGAQKKKVTFCPLAGAALISFMRSSSSALRLFVSRLVRQSVKMNYNNTNN